MEAGEFSTITGKEQVAGWELGGTGGNVESQGRRTEVRGALEKEQCGGSCGLEGVGQRLCKAESQP